MMSTTAPDDRPMPPRPSSGDRVEFTYLNRHVVGEIVDWSLMAAWRESDYRLVIDVDGVRVTKPSAEVEVL